MNKYYLQILEKVQEYCSKNYIKNMFAIISVLAIASCTSKTQMEKVAYTSYLPNTSVLSLSDSLKVSFLSELIYSETDSIFFLSDKTYNIIALDRNFKLKNAYSKQGRGGDEFIGISNMNVFSDSIFVFDASLGKSITFDKNMNIGNILAHENYSFVNIPQLFKISFDRYLSTSNISDSLLVLFNQNSEKTAKLAMSPSLNDYVAPAKNHSYSHIKHNQSKGNSVIGLFNAYHGIFSILDAKDYSSIANFSYENIEFLQETIKNNDLFHNNRQNDKSFISFVVDADFKENYVLLAIGTAFRNYQFSNTVLFLELSSDYTKIVRKHLLELKISDTEIPFVSQIALDLNEKRLIVYDGGMNSLKFYEYDISDLFD